MDLGTLLEKALSETVAVKDAAGRRRRISKGEAAVTQLVNKAAAGADPRAMRLLFDLLAKRHARDGGAPAAGPAAEPGEGMPPAAPALPVPLIHWAGMTTVELVAVHEAIRIIEDHQREPRPADCPMPPVGPGGGEPGAPDPPLRWYTPEPGDPSDAGEEGG